MSKPVSVLFVCMGNICRSPTAEGVFRDIVATAGLSAAIRTDSAGTHDYHIGEPPDPRSIKAAAARGIDISDLRARQVTRADFSRFDYVLAMDAQNHQALVRLCKADARDCVRMFLDFASETKTREVPDPYYGGPDGFEQVLDLCEAASQGLLAHVKARL
ncbi:MAG TPA: low molecular weight protein-tyrosine-phosphatase [Alphaproteobacteria bacterium]|nr:low molecular weight protein-tyrosine-phosphatase [Alphaproteobacteria bacterium]